MGKLSKINNSVIQIFGFLERENKNDTPIPANRPIHTEIISEGILPSENNERKDIAETTTINRESTLFIFSP